MTAVGECLPEVCSPLIGGNASLYCPKPPTNPSTSPAHPFRHFHALLPIGGAVAGAANLFAAEMRELGFDGIRLPSAAFVQEASSARA